MAKIEVFKKDLGIREIEYLNPLRIESGIRTEVNDEGKIIKAELIDADGKVLQDIITSNIPEEYVETTPFTTNGAKEISCTDGAKKFKFTVNVTPNLQPNKTVTENGEVTADAGFDGLSKVTVNVQA